MADSLFSVYDGMHHISGMEKEFHYCNELLNVCGPQENCIALTYVNGTQEWVYGQCNFRHVADHGGQFKFCDTFRNLKDQVVLPTLIRSHAVATLLIDDPALADRIRTDLLTAKYGGLVTLLARTAEGFERPKPPARPSFLSRLGLSRG